MKKLLPYIFIVPVAVAVVLVFGMFFGPKGFPLNLLVFIGEPIVKAFSIVLPDIISEAFLLKIDPYSAPSGYIALVMWIGFAFLVFLGWLLTVVIWYLKRKSSSASANS